MTRETKMGLLVGLAFVLIFGILVSNHLSTTNEPLAAPLREAADTLRSGLGQPGNDDVAPVLRAPQMITPLQPVVTNEELNHRATQPPVRFVAPVVPAPQGQAITFGSNVNSNSSNGTAIDRIRESAQQHGEQLVPDNTLANNNPVNNASPNQAPARLDPPAAPKSAAQTYEAQPGDSLSIIAMKAYGSGRKAYRELIVAANPDLAADRDLIVAGKSYTIPALANGSTPAATALPQAKPAPIIAANLTYTVKPHDTLWSIAIAEVGTPSAVAAIKDLNKDILNGGDGVRPNMKLLLPAKKTAE